MWRSGGCFVWTVFASPLQPKCAIMPLQTSTPRPYNLPYHHPQDFGLDYWESSGGISVIPPRTRTTPKISKWVSLLLSSRVVCRQSCRADFFLVVPTLRPVQDPISRINQEKEWRQQNKTRNPIPEFQLLRARGVKRFSTIYMQSTRRRCVLNSHSVNLWCLWNWRMVRFRIAFEVNCRNR